MRSGMNKLLAVTAVLACVCMWGCGGDVEWSKTFPKSAAQVIGFVDDSLAVVYDYQQWHRDLGSFVQDHGDESGFGHQRLRVFNYRVQEDGPRWADTLDNDDIEDFNYVKGQLSDSVIWGGDPKSEVSFWKIGSKPHKMKVKKVFDGCSIDVRYTTKLRHWLDGKILVMGNRLNPDIEGFDLDSLGSEYCQYAVLDTIQKTTTYKRLDDDLRWIKKCDDVRAWGEDLYCLTLDRMTYNAYLFVNESIVDSMMRDEFKLGNYAVASFLGNYISLHRGLYKYENNKMSRMTSYSDIGISFGDGKGNYVVYDN